MGDHKTKLPVTEDWLINLGMRRGENEILIGESSNPPMAVRLQETSEELGVLVDFYLYSPTRLVNVYSAYYLDRNDFLTDDIYQNMFWRRQNG